MIWNITALLWINPALHLSLSTPDPAISIRTFIKNIDSLGRWKPLKSHTQASPYSTKCQPKHNLKWARTIATQLLCEMADSMIVLLMSQRNKTLHFFPPRYDISVHVIFLTQDKLMADLINSFLKQVCVNISWCQAPQQMQTTGQVRGHHCISLPCTCDVCNDNKVKFFSNHFYYF